ncbi:hypothetical protein Pres01_27860 [Metapseudomonas resinovorans]|nr:hypothetical protein Pres01_27860 [Pseudomonas resinovorans]
MALRKPMQFMERLRSRQHQGLLAGSIEMAMVFVQGRLEGRLADRQAVAIAGMEARRRMIPRQAGRQWQGAAPIGA